MIITEADVTAKLAVDLPVGSQDAAALSAAVTDANALVLAELGWDTIADKSASAVGIATAVARRVAARLWRNPMDAGTESAEGQSLSWSDPRILTGDERAALRPVALKARGPFRSLPLDEELAP